MCELQKQYDFYQNHEGEFLDKYKGRYLVISDDLTVKDYDTKRKAYEAGAEEFGLGNFMLQYCDYDAFHTIHFINVRQTV